MDLDLAKGLGILLVVVGHIVARTPPNDNAWYEVLKAVIYQFHMPFFMYLSGYVTFLSGAANTPLAEWPSLLARRASRLLVPFLVFGLVITVGKAVMSRYLYVDNPPGSFGQAISGLLWNTDASPATFVWYIEVLFVISMITPILMYLAKGNVQLLGAIAVVVYFLPVAHVMYLNLVANFFVFFILGGLAANAGGRWLQGIDRFAWLSVPSLMILLTLTQVWPQFLTPQESLLVCGVVSIPALHGLVRRPAFQNSKTLAVLGAFSFIIYLLNTPCIGLLKGIMLKVMPWDGINFLLYAPLLTLAGTVGPILIKKYVLSRFNALDRLTT